MSVCERKISPSCCFVSKRCIPAYHEYLHFMAKRRHGSAVQDSGENPKCRSGSQGPERSRGDPEGGGQIPVMHPANMAWFGDFLCQKRRCSIFPKVRYLRLASVGEDFLIFWNSLGCGPAQNWSFKYEHWRHVEFILVYESTGDDSSCWESCSFKILQPPHATRQKKCRHGSRFSSKVDLLCLSNGFHCFSLFL